ncbi:ParB N-terminal domain-containing protein [Rhizobium sp. CC-YZS058]|uniref:ParB N-terminal domain-containing protein n=1 Tax=Rhizobium sp. CC-YZS058 TaxID=3042153 RepID=UPI002B05590B|nr:ParB N-terminal domain-containing protein [Rhizobium sp. CC-YZS058]MEA3533690.1 ParB N-terminal domain-containing protein [Rhizobium sp. CC-YZS058]
MADFIRASLTDIHIGDRLRPIDPAYVEAIAASFTERGQISPIMIRRTPAKNKGATPFTLVAGSYRTSAAKLLGWTEIDAIIVEADALEAQLLEISENLFRNELNPLDRAIFVMKYRELWEEQHGKINPNGGRPQKQGHDVPVFSAAGRQLAKEVQERLGFGEGAYKRATRIGQNLHPTLRQAVRGTEAETDQSKLLKLAKLPADDQLKVAAALKESSDLKPVLNWLKGPKVEVDPQQAIFDKMASLWAKADEATQRRFLDHIGDKSDFSFLERAA